MMQRLNRSILAIETVCAHRSAVMIPEGAVVEAISIDTDDTRMTDIHWEGRVMAVFTEDLQERSTLLWARVARGA